ncbi:MAG: ABC transporter permease [Calditrichaceae bacterium]
MRTIQQNIEALRIAFNAIIANRTKGILTTLGLVIGIMAVATTMTAANGLANNFKESISAIGSDVLYVTRMPWIITGNFFEYRNRPRLTYKDCEDLENRMRSTGIVNTTTNTQKNIKYRSTVLEQTPVIGTTETQIIVTEGFPETGRFITPVDVRYKKRVCVIGYEIKERMFQHINPINKDIKIGWYKFRIIGVMEKRGSAGFFGGPNFDNQVFIPVTALIKYFGTQNRGFTVAVKSPSPEAMTDFKYALIGEMRKIRKLKPMEKDNFSINSMDTLMDVYNNIMGVVVLIGLVITGISLFVGGIGVMNIMFVSVTERTREIGIRKAIGAKKSVILTQFLFESSIICLIGGVIGVLMSFGVAEVIDKLVMPASISLPIVIAALIIGILTGVVSGFIPAFRASRLKPIDALRYE